MATGLDPTEPGPLDYANVELTTPAGKIASRWKVHNDKFHLETEIPSGVEATAMLPNGSLQTLRAGRQRLTQNWVRTGN